MFLQKRILQASLKLIFFNLSNIVTILQRFSIRSLMYFLYNSSLMKQKLQKLVQPLVNIIHVWQCFKYIFKTTKPT